MTSLRTFLLVTCLALITANVDVNINFANMLSGFSATTTPSPSPYGYVYAGTNSPTDNRVAVFARQQFGHLMETSRTATGGAGFPGAVDPLGSQGSLIRSPDSKYILYVNGGSNSVSVFRRAADGSLTLTSVTPSQPGMNSSTPTSITAFGNYVYVLNNGALAGGMSSISGFSADWSTGTLTYLQGSTRTFAGNYGQVSFTPDGKFLILPGKGANIFQSFAIDANGQPNGGVISSVPAGRTPFSLTFDRWGNALLSLAFGGVGSYSIDSQGRLTTIQELNTTSAAACWIVRHPSSDVFYVVNSGKPSIGAFRSSPNGMFTQIPGRTMLSATVMDDDTYVFAAGSIPLDAAITNDNKYFYVLLGGRGRIAGFSIDQATGLLLPSGENELLPPGYNGINGIEAF